MSNQTTTYKPTNIPWLGNIPSDWEVRRLKAICRITDGTHDTPKYLDYSEFAFITTKDLKNSNIVFDECKFISKADYIEISKRSDVENGDIIMPMIGTVGGCVIVNENRLFAVKNLAIFKTSKSEKIALTKYLWWFLDSNVVKTQFDLNSRGGVQDFVSQDVLKSIYVILPPLQTQTAIAKYLDAKCDLISKYITDKKQIITLLREQKKSLIYNAVTKGLDKNTKLKSSGVEWLGDIPSDWEVRRLKDICKINPTKGNIVKTEKEVVFLPMEKVDVNGGIEQDLIKVTNQLSTRFTYFEKNDIIFAKITPCFENGKGAYLDKLETEYGFGSTEFHVLRANLQLTIPRYIDYIRRSDSFMNIGETFMQGSAGQKRITTDFIKDFPIPLPPRETQQQIVTYLDTQTAIIDDTIFKIQREIELIQEYKKSLIYNAVTGKIMI
jgi:type I restriction enzyme, S subunit